MPKNYDQSLQQWAAKRLEEDLSEFYTSSLIYQPDDRDYPQPNFQLNPIYKDTEEKSIPAIVESISVAVGRCDYDGFKKLMGPSLVPFQIMHNQKTQQRYWNWLQLSRSLLFYRRVEYLFWGAQKKFFYEELLGKVTPIEEIRVAKPAPGAAKIQRQTSQEGLRKIQKYKENILSHSLSESQFQVDIFFEKLHARNNVSIKEFLDFLTQHKKTISFRSKISRVRASKATRHPLAAIMKTQSLAIPGINAAFCLQKEASPFLVETYRRYLTRVDMTLHRHLVTWLDVQLDRGIDVGEIGQSIQNTIIVFIEHCEDLLESQEEDADILIDIENELFERFYDDHIKKSGIANLALQDPRFKVVDKSKKSIVPMLHFAMRIYADALEKQDMLNAFKIVEILISRGASPFQQLDVTPFEMKKTVTISAFVYADLQPNWEILACVLHYTLVYTPLAEALRIKLESFALENAQALNAWQTRIFQSKKKMEERLAFVSLLTTILQTGDKYDDTQLLNALDKIIKNHTSRFVNSKLHRLLKNILNHKDLIHVTDNRQMEIEIQTLELKEQADESTPYSPQPHALSMRSIFSPGYRMVAGDADFKEEEQADESPPYSPQPHALSMRSIFSPGYRLVAGDEDFKEEEQVEDLDLDEEHSYSPSYQRTF